MKANIAIPYHKLRELGGFVEASHCHDKGIKNINPRLQSGEWETFSNPEECMWVSLKSNNIPFAIIATKSWTQPRAIESAGIWNPKGRSQ